MYFSIWFNNCYSMIFIFKNCKNYDCFFILNILFIIVNKQIFIIVIDEIKEFEKKILL